MTKDEALKLALEALEDSVDTIRREYETDWRHGLPTRKAQLDGMKQALDNHEAAITAIREALAQPEQEPHSWYSKQEDEWMTHKTRMEHAQLNSYTHKVGKFDLALYTAPPQRKPLTDEEIILIVADCASSHQHTDIHFARAIEAAHGIKGEA